MDIYVCAVEVGESQDCNDRPEGSRRPPVFGKTYVVLHYTQSPLQESMWYRCAALWDACVLVKVMRGHGSFADRKDLHARGFYRDHVVDILEPSFDQQESPSDHGETVLTK